MQKAIVCGNPSPKPCGTCGEAAPACSPPRSAFLGPHPGRSQQHAVLGMVTQGRVILTMALQGLWLDPRIGAGETEAHR